MGLFRGLRPCGGWGWRCRSATPAALMRFAAHRGRAHDVRGRMGLAASALVGADLRHGCGQDPLVMDPSGRGPLGLGGALQRRMRLRRMASRASPAEAGLIGARFGAQSQSRNNQAPLMRFRSLQRSLAVPRYPGVPSPERSRFSVLPACSFGPWHRSCGFSPAACLFVGRSISFWHRQINCVCPNAGGPCYQARHPPSGASHSSCACV